MRLIIDNNILFSLMKPDSMNSKIFSSLDCEFIAPMFVISEFEKYKEECLRKSGLSKTEFEKRKKDIFSRILFVKFEEYNGFMDGAIKITPDIDDAPYIALALKMNCPIWSNDSALKKQNKVSILSTEDLIELLF